MTEVMSIAVSSDDQWLVVNGRPVEYYASDTAFLNGRKVWASEAAAKRLADALAVPADLVDFVEGGFPDAIITTGDGQRALVHGGISLHQLGLEAVDPGEIGEEELVILGREMIARAKARGGGVEAAPEPAATPA